MNYWTCRRLRRLLAQAAYEALDDRDRRALDAHVGGCAACRECAASFVRIAATPPTGNATLDRDLLTAVRARLREKSDALSPSRGWRFAGVGAAVAAAILIGVAATWQADPVSPDLSAAFGPVEEGIESAKVLAADRNYSAAYTLLKDRLEAHPDDPSVPQAIQLASDLAFDELELYEAAFRGYETLQQRHRDTFNAAAHRETNQFRWNLLAESRGDDARYEPLHALNRAQGNFEELERLVSRQPVAYVASLAAGEMAQIAMEAEGGDDRIAAMEKALGRCTDPVAMARLKIEVGDMLRGDVDGRARARGIYSEVAGGQHEALARRARESLDELDATSAP